MFPQINSQETEGGEEGEGETETESQDVTTPAPVELPDATIGCNVTSVVQECCAGGFTFTSPFNPPECTVDNSYGICSQDVFLGNATVLYGNVTYDGLEETCSCLYFIEYCAPQPEDTFCYDEEVTICCPDGGMSATCTSEDPSECGMNNNLEYECGGVNFEIQCDSALVDTTLDLDSSSEEIYWWWDETAQNVEMGCFCFFTFTYDCPSPTNQPTDEPTILTTTTLEPKPTAGPTLSPVTPAPLTSYFATYASVFDITSNDNSENLCEYDWEDNVFALILEHAEILEVNETACKQVTNNTFASGVVVVIDVLAEWRDKDDYYYDSAAVERLTDEITEYGPPNIVSVTTDQSLFECGECYLLDFGLINKPNITLLFIWILSIIVLIYTP